MQLKRFFILFCWGLTLGLHAQESCEVIRKTEKLLRTHHVAPIHYDEKTYHEILNLYFESIDSERLIFCLTDSANGHEKIKGSKDLCQVFERTLPLVRKAIGRYDSLLNTLSLVYLTDNKNKEMLHLPCGPHLYWQRDVNQLAAYDRKIYKYVFIEKEYVLKEAGVSLEPSRILNSMVQKRSTYLKKLIANDKSLLTLFLKAVTLRHDPHSIFLDASEKEEWMTHLSKEELSFGFQLEVTEDELYKIGELTPGGAAWNSKQIETGDRIDQIELEGGKKYFPGIDTDEDIYNALSAKNNRTVTFYLTKADGNKASVRLTKTKAEVNSNVVTGYIFKKDELKLGYIDLPSFYSAEKIGGGNGCANDLAREILQLKKDGIDGLILDLRGNGGGYLHEALEIAGLFIDEGVLALKQERGDKPRYLKDPNRGTLYDGKLIVLINAYSASASELLAGTLQQYHRAIVAGSSSFGKATMQQFVPIDSLAEIKGVNQYYVNVTLGKFYMIDKKSNQGLGVIPDIALPGVHDFLDIPKESDMSYYLHSDSVEKPLTIALPPAIPLKDLKTKSEARINDALWIPKLKVLADSLKYYQCYQGNISLDEKSIFAFHNAATRFMQSMGNQSVIEFKAYPVSNTSVFQQVLQEHEMYQRPNELKKEELSKDLRLYEALNILYDYIHQ